MTQSPQAGPGPQGGHPEPEPVPVPEPDPPQPIPPPDPVPAPEPPHTTAEPATFIDGGPVVPTVEWPPIGAYPGEPGHPTAAPHDPTQPLTPAPAAQPWHAQHEQPGEWQYQPPEHLAWQHSPTVAGPAATEPTVAGPGTPTEPIWAGTPAPARRRGGLWVTLALTVILLLCGGGAVSAYFLISNADAGKGAPDPATAVNRFLTAVYTEQDPEAADGMVCRQARDKDKLTARINEIKTYVNVYDSPTFHWSEPQVGGQTENRAVVTVQLTLSTEDEKQAEQALTFTTIHKTGWLVCDVAG